jgi:hypothetical protein
VEIAICVVLYVSPDAVDRVETDNWRLDKFEPATVDKKSTLLLIYLTIALSEATKLLLIIINSFPITVENVDIVEIRL